MRKGESDMTMDAWIFMLLSWAVIIGAVGYCFWKLLNSKRKLEQE